MADSDNGNLPPEGRDAIIRTTLGEAGSDPASQPAVAAVILNRMRQSGQSAIDTVLQRGQFESWATRPGELVGYSASDPDYQRVGAMVDSLASGAMPDPTNGATRFYAPAAQAALGRAPPSWDDGSGVDIGKHRFFGGTPAQPMSDDQINEMYSAPAAGGSAKPMSDDEIGQMYRGAPEPKPLTVTLPGGQNIGFLQPDQTPQPSTAGDAFDRTQPIMDQIGTAARQAGSYLGGQIAGIPGAIASDFHNATGMAVQGMNEVGAGNYLPSFPSSDPSTWSPGGLLKTAGGLAGELAAPISGPVHQLIEDPVSLETGSPQAGQMAGLLATTMVPGAMSRAGASAGNALAGGIIGDLTPETAALADLARSKYNIPVNAGQMSESPGVRFASSALDRLPFSGASDDLEAQQVAFNRAVSNTFGQPADKVTPSVMAMAKDRIGQAFDDVASRSSILVDPQMLGDLRKTLQDADSVLPEAELVPIRNQLRNLSDTVDPATGQISGESYQALTRKGSPLDRAMNSGDPNVRFYTSQIRDALDSALARNAPADLQDQLTTARSQYKAMKTVEDLVEKSPTGNISPALLMGAVRQSYSSLAYGGGGDLGDLARIGQRFLKEPPSSGTAERASTLAGMADLARGAFYGGSTLAAPFFIPHYLPDISPLEAMLPAATVPATLALGRAAGGALRSNALANATINRALGRVAPGASTLPPAALLGLGSFATGQTPQNALAPQ